MAQDFILQHLLGFFLTTEDDTTTSWNVGVHELPRDARTPFAPFLVAARKCRNTNNKVQYNAKEFVSDVGEAKKRWLIHEVEATQWFAMTQAALRQVKVGRQEVIELIANDEKDMTTQGVGEHGAVEDQVNPRFTLRLVDVHTRGPNGSCAVFLIPQGREHEWMFSTEEGANELATGAGFSRLILVALGRGGHAFESTAKVQEELNAKVMELAPDTLRTDEKIPYLTVQEGLGARNIVHQGTSPLSGAFFVEEVQEDGNLLRRLVFLSNTNVIQSEVKLQRCESAALTPLAASAPLQPSGMVAALHAASLSLRTVPDALHRTLVLGLGGGCLAQYLHDNVPGMDVTACELDPTIVTVAKQYFGFCQDQRMRVVVADALKYVAEQSTATEKPSFDSIIVDVDAKQRDVGMSCPPVSFVEVVFLAHVHALLAPHGVLLINVSCRDSGLYNDIIARLQRVFTGSRAVLALKPSEQDVNSIVFIRKADAKEPDAEMLLQQLHDQGCRRGKTENAPRYVDDELNELIRDIKITK
ncbi:unnamed protein product [Peronospora destructor]|uniref:Methyltransferase-like protein 13 n=1 Tax=Peronospora destructor TaxID=86335 RepID=A0AAV0VDL9_9STRA|nr:unnamed protein product [Peronospora destructor]